MPNWKTFWLLESWEEPGERLPALVVVEPSEPGEAGGGEKEGLRLVAGVLNLCRGSRKEDNR